MFEDKPWFAEFGPLIDSNSVGTVVTADSTPHTKGSWTQLVASTSAEINCLVVTIVAVALNATDTASLLDIGVGASGSESAVAENIAVGGAGVSIPAAHSIHFVLPVKIAAGSRIAARLQSLVGSRSGTVTVNGYNFGATQAIPTTLDVLGTNTATSEGTALAASNTWTQIVSSTAKDILP